MVPAHFKCYLCVIYYVQYSFYILISLTIYSIIKYVSSTLPSNTCIELIAINSSFTYGFYCFITQKLILLLLLFIYTSLFLCGFFILLLCLQKPSPPKCNKHPYFVSGSKNTRIIILLIPHLSSPFSNSSFESYYGQLEYTFE